MTNFTQEDEDLIKKYFNEAQDLIKDDIGFPSHVKLHKDRRMICIHGPKGSKEWDADEFLATLRNQIS